MIVTASESKPRVQIVNQNTNLIYISLLKQGLRTAFTYYEQEKGPVLYSQISLTDTDTEVLLQRCPFDRCRYDELIFNTPR